MPEQIENSMVVDWWWERFENGAPMSDKELKRERQALEEAEYGVDDDNI